MSERSQPDTPEPIKNLAWVYAGLVRHWRLFVTPPVLALAASTGVIGYWFGARQEGDRTAVKDERISFLNEQLGAYRDRLNGATPDEAAKKVKDLEAVVAKQTSTLKVLYPDTERHLSESAKTTLKANLGKIAGPVYIAYSAIADSPAYAFDIATFLSDNHVKVIGPVQGNCGRSQQGLLLNASDDGPTRPVKEFAGALAAAGIDYRYSATRQVKKEESLSPDSIVLLICVGSSAP